MCNCNVMLGLTQASQNAIAAGYGSGERLQELQEQLQLAYECEDWGISEWFACLQ